MVYKYVIKYEALMTLRTRIPLSIYQAYFLFRDSFDSVIRNLEVILNGKAIIYSVRIMIIIMALLMGYYHTPKDATAINPSHTIELPK